ncbi:MAG TPA: ABC transporter permease [Verrucomicrobiae bacterium]|nr:ABC transporter permease [Verrucomicrobiae bacterium]
MNLFTEIKEGLGISWGAIRANKMRSSLTTLGIVIGIVTVTLMGTAIEGLDRFFHSSVSFIGADVMFVSRGSWFIDSHSEWLAVQKRRDITMDQVKAVEKQMTLARAVAPVVGMRQSVKYKNRNANGVRIIGTTEQFLFTGGFSVAQGRFMTEMEVEGGRPVCVIGSEVATNLFLREPALGNKIKIGPDSFEVVGVLEKQGSFLGQFSLDNQAIIPVKHFVARFWRRPDYEIQIKASELGKLEEAKEELRSVLRILRRVPPGAPDDFSINQQEQFLTMFNRVTATIAAVGLFITGLSLFVGGIGIMNIMFVSVAERTREIGLRKAIGAKRRTILVQFLIEAASICMLGGLLALAIAWPLTLVMSKFLPAVMSITVASIALLVSFVTGILSGFLPAWRAARMNPVDALRNE